MGSVFGPCLVMQYLAFFLVLQSSLWGRVSCLLYFNCLPDGLRLLLFCSVALPCDAVGSSAVCAVVLPDLTHFF